MMTSSYPILSPVGCCHLLLPHSLSLTEDSGSNFRLPFHPHSCHHSGWPHHLCCGNIQQPDLTLDISLLNARAFHSRPPASQGHTGELCRWELVVQSLATTSCSSNLLMPHSHNIGSLTSQNPPLPHFSPFILLCSPRLSEFSFPPQSGPHAWSSELRSHGTLKSLVLLSFCYHCSMKPQPWLKAVPSSFQSYCASCTVLGKSWLYGFVLYKFTAFNLRLSALKGHPFLNVSFPVS